LVTIPATSIQALGAEVAPCVPLPKKQTARAYVRYLDDALVRAAGELFKATDIPDALPIPDRSNWR
jgi:hypothetical protein